MNQGPRPAKFYVHVQLMLYGFVLQLKNAESILEYERMAEIGFDKRDFRMVRESHVDE